MKGKKMWDSKYEIAKIFYAVTTQGVRGQKRTGTHFKVAP